jgi:steroid delta-isomerase-like uncharacterized protein
MSDKYKDLYCRVLEEVWNKGDLDRVEDFFAPDVVIHHAPPNLPSGREGVRATVSLYRGAFPDLTLKSQSLVAEGNTVAAFWRLRGTHKGDLMGVPATGKRVESYGMSLMRFDNGRVAEIWGASDQLGLLRQLGAFPEAGQGSS